MRSVKKDFKSASRMLVSNPGFTVAALITLVVGIMIKASLVTLVAGAIAERLVR